MFGPEAHEREFTKFEKEMFKINADRKITTHSQY